jgi:retron-type reverse transcriptase
MSEIPVHPRPRRLADWINPTGVKKVHSLIDKVYQRKNLEMAWEMVKANRGSGGVDGQSLDGFAEQLGKQLDRLQSELKEDVYRPHPVRQVQIPKEGKPGEFRTLGIPTIYDNLSHDWLLKFVQHRVADRRILRLIQKWLKAGVMEEGEWKDTEMGTPQGSVASPLLANIYLHYVFDLWVDVWRKKCARGDVVVVRYADDNVLGF